MKWSFLVAWVLSLNASAYASDIGKLNDKWGQSVFKLELLDAYGDSVGSGTGWVAEPGIVVTNAHVVQPATAIRLQAKGTKSLYATSVLVSDKKADLALIRVKASLPPEIPLAQSNPKPGAEVLVIGSPLGLAGSVSAGIVAAIRDDLDPKFGFEPNETRIQMTAPISGGSSGSPVLNAEGEVVGIAVSTLRGGDALHFAVPISRLHELMAKMPVDSPERELVVGASGTRWVIVRNIIVSVLFFGAILVALKRYA